jgi:hypothetical protein
VPGDEWDRASRRRFRDDHAESLGEDRRNDRDVSQRDQVDEVAVLERAGEEDIRAGHGLQLGAVIAEADDDGARIDAIERFKKEMDALVPEQLAEVEDRRRTRAGERGKPLGVAFVREPLVGVPRVRWVAAALLEQPSKCLFTRFGAKHVDVHARRNLVQRSTCPTTSSSTSRMCTEPTKTAPASASASLPSPTVLGSRASSTRARSRAGAASPPDPS